MTKVKRLCLVSFQKREFIPLEDDFTSRQRVRKRGHCFLQKKKKKKKKKMVETLENFYRCQVHQVVALRIKIFLFATSPRNCTNIFIILLNLQRDDTLEFLWIFNSNLSRFKMRANGSYDNFSLRAMQIRWQSFAKHAS